MNRFRFIKIREVSSPMRANQCDAGLDFFIPTNLDHETILKANEHALGISFTRDLAVSAGMVSVILDPKTKTIQSIILGPSSRISIPSGIKPLLEPQESMLMAANKSGISTKKGLIYTAEIVDSPYIGEIHLGVANIGATAIEIKAGDKLTQFIHVPVYLTEPIEIQQEEFYSESQMWGSRGEAGMGSNKVTNS